MAEKTINMHKRNTFYEDNQRKVSFPDWIRRVAQREVRQNNKDKRQEGEGVGNGKRKASR